MAEYAIGLAAQLHWSGDQFGVLRELAISESGHQRLIADCLDQVGVDSSALADVKPLDSTLGVGSFIIAQAAHGPLPFLSLFLLSEARERERLAGLNYLQNVERAAGLPQDALAGLGIHMENDLDALHASSLAQYLQDQATIPRSVCDSVVSSMHSFKHLMDRWYEEIRVRPRDRDNQFSYSPQYRDIA